MKTLCFVLFLNIFHFSLFSSYYIGKVLDVKGNCYITQKKKKKIAKDTLIFKGSIITTQKNSYVIILLKNGMKKFISANTEIHIYGKKQLKRYQEIHKNINFIYSIAGKKATREGKDSWYSDKNEIKLKIKKLFLYHSNPKIR